jgi:hypothetical protein
MTFQATTGCHEQSRYERALQAGLTSLAAGVPLPKQDLGLIDAPEVEQKPNVPQPASLLAVLFGLGT